MNPQIVDYSTMNRSIELGVNITLSSCSKLFPHHSFEKLILAVYPCVHVCKFFDSSINPLF